MAPQKKHYKIIITFQNQFHNSKDQILSGLRMSVLDEKVITLAKYLENKNAQEIQEFLTSIDRQLNKETEKVQTKTNKNKSTK